MTDPFFLKLLLAFGVGSLMVTAATVFAETSGTNIGGLVGGLPTMVSTTLFFIGLVENPRLASEATTFIPMIVGFNGLFLVVYAVLARWGGWVGLTGALFSWVALSSLVFLLEIQSFLLSLAAYLLFLVFSYLVLEKKLCLRSAGRLRFRYTPSQIAFRAFFSGGIVASAVYFSKVGGPVWGGILAPFPTVYLSTLIIIQRSSGVEHSRAMTKSLLVSGMVNVVAYAIAVRYLYLAYDLLLGTILALAIAGVSAYGTYLFMKRKMT